MSHTRTDNQLSLTNDPIAAPVAYNPLEPLTGALDSIFRTTTEEGRIQKTRRIMGTLLQQLSDEEVEIYMTEFQYLVDEWLDDFERQAFDGKTLKQVLAQE